MLAVGCGPLEGQIQSLGWKARDGLCINRSQWSQPRNHGHAGPPEATGGHVGRSVLRSGCWPHLSASESSACLDTWDLDLRLPQL